MKEKFFKKFEGLFSLFGIQALAVKKINEYTKSQLLLDDLYFFKEGYLVVYIYQSDVERIRSFVFSKIKDNPSYLGELYTESIKGFESFNSKYDKFDKEIKQIKKADELKKWIGDFVELASDTNAPAFLAEMFAGYDDFWLKYCDIKKEDFDILMVPEEPSFTKEYSHDLAKIKLKKSKKTKEEISSKYFWVQSNYKVVDLVTSEQVSLDLGKMTILEAEKIEEESKTYLSEILKKKQDVLNNIKIEKDKAKLINSLSSFVSLQDKRKEVILKTNSLFIKASKKLLDLYEITKEEERNKIIASSFPTWFSDLGPEELNERSKKAFICHYYPVTGESLIGLKAVKVFEKISSDENRVKDVSIIHGRTAYKGLVRGEVRIITKGEDFSKFIDGEILVTHMTRPEFVPLIKKSSAIITDEGGITCHAAIVSRELKIPCIIGTIDATKRLKDGDMVEVDANNGIVRIIK